MSTWRVIEKTRDLLVLSMDGATLLLERPRPATFDPDLRGAIARLAPHLEFGELAEYDETAERIATTCNERVVVGRMRRGAMTIAYVVASGGPMRVDDVVRNHFDDVSSPFDNFAD